MRFAVPYLLLPCALFAADTRPGLGDGRGLIRGLRHVHHAHGGLQRWQPEIIAILIGLR